MNTMLIGLAGNGTIGSELAGKSANQHKARQFAAGLFVGIMGIECHVTHRESIFGWPGLELLVHWFTNVRGYEEM